MNFFFLGIFYTLFLEQFSKNLAKIHGLESTQKEKVQKPRILKCYYLLYVSPPQKIQQFLGHFWPFLPYFT